jgi:hypothetical protein
MCATSEIAVDEPGLSMGWLAGHRDQTRLGLVYGDGTSVEFVIDDMNGETAEVFSGLRLGGYIPL